MKAYALSWWQFTHLCKEAKIDDTNVGTVKQAFIELMGEQDILSAPWVFNQDHSNVLRLMFDDVDEPLHVPLVGDIPDNREYIPVVPMSEAQGQQILDFVRANEDKKVFIVHCAAGVSRSGAVAKFIMEYFGETHLEYWMINKNTQPNIRIVNILRKLNEETNSGGDKVDNESTS